MFRIPVLFVLCGWIHLPAWAGWEAGAARADITPKGPVPLAGYGGKTRLSTGVDHPIWLKALALRHDGGAPAVIVTADLVGLSPTMVGRITRAAMDKHGLPAERLILNTSHNHSCPITEDVLWLYYELSAADAAARDAYTAQVYAQYERVIHDALAALAPAELAFEQGLAGVAVNRRRSRPEGRKLPGPVDPDVPVLAIRSGGALRSVLFGYSCHTTALGGLTINGDYVGFAQLEIEKARPGVTALFMQNCGGDANPLPRIRGDKRQTEAVTLAEMYGRILAEAVGQVLDGPMKPVSGPLRTARREVALSLQAGPPLEEVKQRLPNLSGMPRREFEHFLRQYERHGSLPERVNYPVQAWSLGPECLLIALTGETVVDYSLRFKGAYGWDSTWVCGYNNDLLSYVPSLRVLKEGGYEGVTGMYEYGHRAPYTEAVEQTIADAVEDLVNKVKAPGP